MIIYYLLVLFLIFFSLISLKKKNDDTNKKIFLIISFVLIILIAGLRKYTVGTDTHQFIEAFIRISKLSITEFSSERYEYGFTFLCWVLSKITSNPQILIFVSSIIINIAVAKFIYNNSNNIYLSTILYIITTFFFSYMNIMRAALAIAFILFGYEYLKKDNLKMFIIFVLISISFHFSAILSLLFVFLRKRKINKNIICMSIIFMIIGLLFGKQIFLILSQFSPRLNNYIGGEYDVENYAGALIKFFVYFLSYLFGLYIIFKKQKFNSNDKKTNFEILAVGVANIFAIMTMRVSIFNRFSPYFTIFLITWLPNTITMLRGKDRIFFNVLITVLFCLYSFVILYYRPEWYCVSNYMFYWQ